MLYFMVANCRIASRNLIVWYFKQIHKWYDGTYSHWRKVSNC